MSTIACPRHGVVDVDKDQPCPDCGVAAYDLDDRLARDVVRQNRELAHKSRKIVAGVLLFVGATVAAVVCTWLYDGVLLGGESNLEINFTPLLAGGVAAGFGARTLALKLERDPRLRRLDEELTRRRV